MRGALFSGAVDGTGLLPLGDEGLLFLPFQQAAHEPENQIPKTYLFVKLHLVNVTPGNKLCPAFSKPHG